MKTVSKFLWVATLLVTLISGCGDNSTNSKLQNGLATDIYRALTSSGFLKDTRIRENAPTQTQGSVPTVKIGDDNGGAMDGLFMDSSVVFLDSIPSTSTIVACTLFVKVSQLPALDGDSVKMDLWSITEPWNENEASWNARTSSVNWSVAGAPGSVIHAGVVTLTRLDILTFRWSVDSTEFGEFAVSDTTTLPIPIDTALARQNLEGSCYGFALRRNASTSSGAQVSFYSSENAASVNRPYILWVFQ